MVSEIQKQEQSRLTNSNGVSFSPLNTKVKDKARQQLWDSLLEVYEKEADKGCEEVGLDDIETWSVTHKGDGLKALPQLAQTDPLLVFRALPGSLEDLRTEQLEVYNNEKPQQLEKKRKRNLTTSRSIRCNSILGHKAKNSLKIKRFQISANVSRKRKGHVTISKNSKNNPSVYATAKKNVNIIKTTSKLRYNSTNHNKKRKRNSVTSQSSSFNLRDHLQTHKNIHIKKIAVKPKSTVVQEVSASLKKKKKIKENAYSSMHNSSVCVQTKNNIDGKDINRKNKSIGVKTPPSRKKKREHKVSRMNEPKSPYKILAVQYVQQNHIPVDNTEKNSAEHHCNLKLRYPNKVENVSTRPDGRIFSCRLVFKLCECFESDENF